MYKSVIEINSFQNQRIKQVIKLRNRRDRNVAKRFIIEGYRELLHANKGTCLIDSLFVCKDLFLGENEESLIASIQEKGAQIFYCSPQIFKKISYRDRPDGLLGIAPHMDTKLDILKPIIEKKQAPFFVIAEAIEKPGNLGTIIRSCDAAKVDGIIVTDPVTDIHNPNVVRASIGTLFTQPIIEASNQQTLGFLKENNIAIVSATPGAKMQFTEVDLTMPLAILVGAEQYGLSSLWFDEAGVQVKIPMHGIADSLNVATATTLMIYEVLRQRSAS